MGGPRVDCVRPGTVAGAVAISGWGSWSTLCRGEPGAVAGTEAGVAWGRGGCGALHTEGALAGGCRRVSRQPCGGPRALQGGGALAGRLDLGQAWAGEVPGRSARGLPWQGVRSGGGQGPVVPGVL